MIFHDVILLKISLVVAIFCSLQAKATFFYENDRKQASLHARAAGTSNMRGVQQAMGRQCYL
jgi:hypothetical protein